MKITKNKLEIAMKYFRKSFFIFVIGLLLFSATWTSIIIIKKYENIYRYDVKKDYLYNFHNDPKVTKSIAINIYDDYFIMQEREEAWDTAFLKIKLESSLLGKIVEPFMEIKSEDVVIQQYFERGVRGIRYVNISPLLRERKLSKTKIILKGHHLSWASQHGQLIVFKKHDLSNERILILSPHPDDAEIAAFGLYSYKNSHIITITSGDAGPNSYEALYPEADKLSAYLLKGKLRVLDSIYVSSLGGISPLRSINLGYFDGTLKIMYKFPDKNVESTYAPISDISTYRKYNLTDIPLEHRQKATWINLIRDLTFALQNIKPSIIVAPHPQFDSHPDHQYSSIALFEAIKRSGLKDGSLFLYTNHEVLTKYYPYGPSDSLVSLPPNFDTTIFFRSIYSHGLTSAQQIEKRFALDTHHDLRGLPPPVKYELYDLIKDCTRIIYTYLKSLAGLDDSYYRRTIRPNELFFIYSFQDTDMLKELFIRNPI